MDVLLTVSLLVKIRDNKLEFILDWSVEGQFQNGFLQLHYKCFMASNCKILYY